MHHALSFFFFFLFALPSPLPIQIYRPDFVLLHFVHYSTITNKFNTPKAQLKRNAAKAWKRWYKERSGRFADKHKQGSCDPRQDSAVIQDQQLGGIVRAQGIDLQAGHAISPPPGGEGGWVFEGQKWNLEGRQRQTVQLRRQQTRQEVLGPKTGRCACGQ